MLERLKNKIPKVEVEKRRDVFIKAHKYIEQAAKNGGLNATSFATFNVKGTPKERIDIEIRSGIAFVTDNNDY